MQNDKWFFVVVFVGLILCPLLVFAAYPVSQYPYVPPIEKMQHNGEYGIYVLKEGKWQDAGKLTHDEFFRETAIDLSRYISGREETRVRIVQKGGEAAHIDSVLLGVNIPNYGFAIAGELPQIPNVTLRYKTAFQETSPQ